jgi:hypothetical protein
MKSSLFLGLAAATLSVSAANASLDPMYFGIGSVEVRELPEDPAELEAVLKDSDDSVSAASEVWFEKEKQDAPIDTAALGGLLGLTEGEVGIFLRVGKEVWKIIKENEPVMNTTYNAVSVLPKEVTEWSQMANWQAPKSQAYQVIYKNLYGIEVVRFSYRLTFTAGGTFKSKGQYLSNVSVSPIHVRVLWGYELNADVAVKNIQNTASVESPVPGVEVQINYKVSTIFAKEENAQVFYVRGDGYAQKLN